MNSLSSAFRTMTLSVLCALSLWRWPVAASPDEIKVMTSGGFTTAYLDVIPQFERATQTRVVTSFGASMGGAPDSIPSRLERHEPVDVVILASTALDDLIRQGRVVAGSRVDLARSRMGMAVRAGASKPDISSVEALKRTLLGARSIAYSASASGVYLSTELFQRLGIAEQVMPKSKRIESERVGAVVARGEAEIGFQQISELLSVPGIDYVGPLPPEVQRVTVFSAGIAVEARGARSDAARRLIRFLASPGVAPAIRKSGLEPVAAFHLIEATIDDVHAALQAGTITCRQLVELYIKRIEAYDKTSPALNAVQTVNARALQEADRLDATFKSTGLSGSLHCIPVLVKDQIETSDMPTTYGSAVFQDFTPQRDATAVVRLKKAGAIIVGKATMGEYASGYFGSASGPIRNAYDPRRQASGSSGGTGTGIAANFATVGIGEDTGGSIRGPAAVSGLVGLRPTLPLVSRHGMLPARPSTDTLGPLTRTVKDAAIVLDAIAGYDPADPVTAYAVGRIPTSYTASLAPDGLKGARIGVIRQPMDAKTDPASDDYRKVKAVIDKAVDELRALGAEIVDPVTIPGVIDRVAKAFDANQFETEPAINKYLAHHANAPAKTLRDILLSGKVVPSRARALMNSVGKSTDDSGYLQVLLAGEEMRQIVLALMADNRLDALAYATFDHQPTVIAPDVMTRLVVEDAAGLGNNRRLSPTLGFPAMTVPAGFTTDGLPVGIEFMSRPFTEATLFKLGYAYEQGTHHRKPPALTPATSSEP